MHIAFDPLRREKGKIYDLGNGHLVRDGHRWYGEEFERKSAWRHYSKYEALAQQLGVEHLKRLVPVSAEVVREAMSNGDDGLNTIPQPYSSLKTWEGASYLITGMALRAGLSPWWTMNNVCLLKHVARYHVAGLPAPPEG